MSDDLKLKLILSADGKQLQAVTKDAEGNIRKLGSASTKAGAQVSTGMNKAAKSTQRVSTQAKNTTAGVNSLGNAGVKAGGQVSAGMNKAEVQTKKTSKQSDLLAKSLKHVGVIAASAVAFGGIVTLGTKLVTTIQRVQDIDVRLKGLTKSSKDYAGVTDFLVNLSDRHHKSVLTLSDSFSKLLTLEKAGITTRRQSKKIIEGLSNASAEAGATNDQLKQSIFGISQALGSGTLKMEELNQVTEPIPGLLNNIATAAGHTVGDFRKLVGQGKITSEMFGTILTKSFESYNGAAERAADNLTAKYADIENAWVKLAKVVESPVADVMNPILENVASGIGTVAAHSSELGDIFGAVATIVSGQLAISMASYAKQQIDIVKTTKASIKAETESAKAVKRSADGKVYAAQKEFELAKAQANRTGHTGRLKVATTQLTIATKAAAVANTAYAATTRAASSATRLMAGAVGAIAYGELINQVFKITAGLVEWYDAEVKLRDIEEKKAKTVDQLNTKYAQVSAQLHKTITSMDDFDSAMKSVRQETGLNIQGTLDLNDAVKAGAIEFDKATGKWRAVDGVAKNYANTLIVVTQEQKKQTAETEKGIEKARQQINSLEQQVNAQQRIVASKIAGVEATNKTAAALSAEQQIRSLGIQSTSKHAVQIRNLSQALSEYNLASAGITATVEAENQSYQSRLSNLVRLHAQGIISEQEFQNQKEQLNIGHNVRLEQQEVVHQQTIAEIRNYQIQLEALQAKFENQEISISIFNALKQKLEAEHQSNLQTININAQKNKLSGLEVFTKNLLNKENEGYFKSREALRVALDNNLITQQEFNRLTENAIKKHESDVKLIRDNAAKNYINTLGGLAGKGEEAAGRISTAMKNAAGSMATDFSSASKDAIKSIKGIERQAEQALLPREQPQRQGQPQEPQGSPFSQGKIQNLIPIPPNVTAFQRLDINTRNRQIEQENQAVRNAQVQGGRFYHSGGIVGEDVGSREVSATLLQGEGVFTEHQMSALAPVHEIMRALAKDKHTSPAEFNAGVDDFLAEYARINAKHVENFEIAAIRLNDGFRNTAINMVSALDAIELETKSVAGTAFNTPTGNIGGGSANGGTPDQQQTASKELSDLSQQELFELKKEFLGIDSDDPVGIFSRNKNGSLYQGGSDTALNYRSRSRNEVIGSGVLATQIVGQGQSGADHRFDAGRFVDISKLSEFFAEKQGVSVSDETIDALKDSIENLERRNQSLIGIRNGSSSSTARFEDEHRNVSQELGLRRSSLDRILADRKKTQQQAKAEENAEIQNNRPTLSNGIPTQQAASPNITPSLSTGQQNPIDLFYGGLQPLQNFVDINKDAQEDIIRFSKKAANDINRIDTGLWDGVGGNLSGYVADFEQGMQSIVNSYLTTVSQINAAQIESPSFGQAQTEPTGGTDQGFDVFDRNAKAPDGWRWTQSVDPKRWVQYFHNGGIVGKDPGGKEVDARLLKGEGVFTENQMAALAPVSMLANKNGGGNNVQINVHEAANTNTQVQQSEQPDGSIRIDIIARAVEGQIIRNFQQGRGIARPLQQQYNLSRGGR